MSDVLLLSGVSGWPFDSFPLSPLVFLAFFLLLFLSCRFLFVVVANASSGPFSCLFPEISPTFFKNEKWQNGQQYQHALA